MLRNVVNVVEESKHLASSQNQHISNLLNVPSSQLFKLFGPLAHIRRKLRGSKIKEIKQNSCDV